MKNKKWSKLVQIGKTRKAEKCSHRKHRNTQKRSSHRKRGNTQKFFCAEKDVVFFHGDTQRIFCGVEGVVFFHGKHRKKTKAQRSHGRVDCLG